MTGLREYDSAEHALQYLSRADRITHRSAGEAVVCELVPRDARRILDLGSGDGRLLALLEPGGVFYNLEHVASPTPELHAAFFVAMGMTLADEAESNQLLDVETQVKWLREIGFAQVDCFWKWRELAVVGGMKP